MLWAYAFGKPREVVELHERRDLTDYDHMSDEELKARLGRCSTRSKTGRPGQRQVSTNRSNQAGTGAARRFKRWRAAATLATCKTRRRYLSLTNRG